MVMRKIVTRRVVVGYNYYLGLPHSSLWPGCHKKQSTVAQSTTEAETVALSHVLYEEGLPILELWKQLLNREVHLREGG